MKALYPILTLGLLAGCGPDGWKLLEAPRPASLRGVTVESRVRAAIAGEGGAVFELSEVELTESSTDAAMPLLVPDYFGVAYSSDGLTVAGDRGVVLSLRDAGWAPEDSRGRERLLALARATPTLLYAGGDGGRVIRRVTGERRWERVDVGAPGSAKITGIWAIGAESVALSTDRGTVIERVAGDWVTSEVKAETSSTTLPVFGVWSSTRGADLVAVGFGGSIFRRKAGAEGWTQEVSPVREDLYAVWGNAPDRIYVVGSSGTILRYDGARWAGVPSGTGQDLFALAGSADGKRLVAVGARGTIVILDED